MPLLLLLTMYLHGHVWLEQRCFVQRFDWTVYEPIRPKLVCEWSGLGWQTEKPLRHAMPKARE